MFNINTAANAFSVQPTISPTALLYKVNVTLNYKTYCFSF
jgi:hypothetical protein